MNEIINKKKSNKWIINENKKHKKSPWKENKKYFNKSCDLYMNTCKFTNETALTNAEVKIDINLKSYPNKIPNKRKKAHLKLFCY